MDWLKFGMASTLFCIYFISLVWSSDLISGMVFLRSQLFLILVPLVAVLMKAEISTKKLYWIHVYLYAVSLAWLTTIIAHLLPAIWMEGLAQHERLFLPYSIHDTRLFGMYSPFIPRIQLSNFLAVGFFLGGYSYYRSRSLLSFFTALWLLSGLILLGGRGGQGGWFVASFFLCVFGGSQYFSGIIKKAAFSFSILILFLLTAYVLLFHVDPVRSRYAQHRYEMDMIRSGEYKQLDYTHFTTLRRMVSWENSLSLLKSVPFLGTGIGDYTAAYQKTYDTDPFDLPVNNHSQYLHIAGATGWVGLAVFICSLFILLYSIYRVQPVPDRYFAIATILVFLVAFIPDAVLLKQVDNCHFAWIVSFWLWSKN